MYSSFERFYQLIKQFRTKLHSLSFLDIKQNKKIVKSSSSNLLSDNDYEFLLNQLLDGVTHGWHEGRILKYFEDLEERGKAKLWISWLSKFREKVLSSDNPDLQLASRMMRLGELAQSFPSIEPVGKISYDIGQELFNKKTENEIWEYIDIDTSDIKNNILTEQIFPSISLKKESLIVEDLEYSSRNNEDPIVYLSDELSSSPINSKSSAADISALSKEYFERGMERFKLRDWEKAIFLWDKALAINPSFSIAWYNRGKALGCLGENDQAISSFDNALALNPKNIDFLNAKAQLLYDLQNWSESIKLWEQILNFEPSNYKIWYNRGRCLESMKQISKATDSYKEALKIVPDLKPVLKRLQKLYDT